LGGYWRNREKLGGDGTKTPHDSGWPCLALEEVELRKLLASATIKALNCKLRKEPRQQGKEKKKRKRKLVGRELIGEKVEVWRCFKEGVFDWK